MKCSGVVYLCATKTWQRESQDGILAHGSTLGACTLPGRALLCDFLPRGSVGADVPEGNLHGVVEVFLQAAIGRLVHGVASL